MLGIAIIKKRGLDELKINPNIGIGYPKLTRLVDELTEIKSENEYVNIIAPKNIGYMSHYKTFMGYQVSNSKELKKVTKTITNDILEFGIPHMKKFLNRDFLVEEMKINVPEYAATKLPVFYLLEGKEELIDETIEHYYKLRGHFDWFKESYSIFEKKLRNYMNANDKEHP